MYCIVGYCYKYTHATGFVLRGYKVNILIKTTKEWKKKSKP